MRYVKPPHRTDRSISYSNWSQLYDQNKKLLNITFDPATFFVMDDPTGVYVAVNPSSIISTMEEDRYHWRVETNAAASNSSSLIVRGGYWNRELPEGLGSYKIALTCDSGAWDEDYDNSYKSLQTATSTASYYIYVELDNPLHPTTCTAKSSLTWPAYDNARSSMVIAWTNCASGEIEQFLEGDYYDAVYSRPDSQLPGQSSYSIQVNNTTGRTMLYDFTNASSAVMVTGDLVVIRQDNGIGGNHTVRYTNKVLNAAYADSAGTSGSSSYALDAGTAAFADVAGSGWPTSWAHAGLSDIIAGTDGDEHNGDPQSGVGNFPYISGRANRLANSVAPGVTIDDATRNESILVNERELRAADNAPVLVWSSADCYLQIALGLKTLKWAARQLVTGDQVELDWSDGVHEMTNSWSTTLDFSVGRTCDAYQFEITDQPGDNYWDSDDLIVEVDNTVDIHATTSLVICAQGGRAILLDADIDLQTGGQLQINGAMGKTGYVDDGTNFRLTFTKGLITAVANTAGAGWASD